MASPTSQSPHLEAHHILLQHGAVQRNLSRSSASSSSQIAMRGAKDSGRPRSKANSDGSRGTRTSSTAGSEHNGQARVRSLPPWISSFEEGDSELITANPTHHILSAPCAAHAAQHHYAANQLTRKISQDGYVEEYDEAAHGLLEKKAKTGFFGGHQEPVRGRKWDHARESEPVIVQAGTANPTKWSAYIKSSMYGPAIGEDSELVSNDVLQQQTPGYEKPWRGDLESNDTPPTRSLMKRLQHLLLMHPLVPLIFRITVLTTSIIALGLSASVHHLSNNYSYRQSPSATMAIAVDVVAIPYILYVTWDEYTGKPLGLRSPKAKIRLVLLDLFFIIFESANLSLAFGSLTDNDGSCKSTANGYSIICNRVKALCGILFMALLAWSLTFALSIFRVVERVGGKEDSD